MTLCLLCAMPNIQSPQFALHKNSATRKFKFLLKLNLCSIVIAVDFEIVSRTTALAGLWLGDGVYYDEDAYNTCLHALTC